MAVHSSILAWRIPWSEEPGRLQSTGSHRVRHDRSDLAAFQLVNTTISTPSSPTLMFLSCAPNPSTLEKLMSTPGGVLQDSSSRAAWLVPRLHCWFNILTMVTSLMVQWLRRHSQCRGPWFSSCSGTRSHMLQLRFCSSHATGKIRDPECHS